MALSALIANMQQIINWSASGSNGTNFSTTDYNDAFSFIKSLGFGTATMKANQLYAATRSVAINANDDIDLSGSLANFKGETINFTEIKYIGIFNRSSKDGNNLKIGSGGNNSWVAPFKASNNEDNCYARGVWERSAPLTGFAVVAGTGDILRVQNAGTTVIDYDIIIIGVG